MSTEQKKIIKTDTLNENFKQGREAFETGWRIGGSMTVEDNMFVTNYFKQP